MKRSSIASTYDSAKDGLQYSVATAVNGRSLDSRDIPDPFARHTVRLSVWDTLRGLFTGGVTVEMHVEGKNPRIVEDVLELDEQYLGWGSDRRDEFTRRLIERAIDGR